MYDELIKALRDEALEAPAISSIGYTLMRKAADVIEELLREANRPSSINEYIEREAAVNTLNKALFSYEDETEARFKDDPELDLAEWFFHRIFVQVMNGRDRQAILDLPAADVRPVVRGKWRLYSPLTDTYECDKCGYQVIDESFRTNFCPNCGAMMEES